MNKIDAILIIDDDPRNVFALKTVLKSKKYQCETANSFHEALKILKNKSNIALILIDMMMPDVDGYQAIKELKASDIFNEIPVIAITAQAMSGDKEKCMDSGADGYVAKPVDMNQLMIYINKYIKNV